MEGEHDKEGEGKGKKNEEEGGEGEETGERGSFAATFDLPLGKEAGTPDAFAFCCAWQCATFSIKYTTVVRLCSSAALLGTLTPSPILRLLCIAQLQPPPYLGRAWAKRQPRAQSIIPFNIKTTS